MSKQRFCGYSMEPFFSFFKMKKKVHAVSTESQINLIFFNFQEICLMIVIEERGDVSK